MALLFRLLFPTAVPFLSTAKEGQAASAADKRALGGF